MVTADPIPDAIGAPTNGAEAKVVIAVEALETPKPVTAVPAVVAPAFVNKPPTKVAPVPTAALHAGCANCPPI